MTGDIASFITAEVGKAYLSDWMLVDQPLIDRFAETTQDRNLIHVDPVAAREAGQRGTIAHGFLTLSLMVPLCSSLADRPSFPGVRAGFNYGLEGVRFLSPVVSGSRIRGHFAVASVDETKPGHYRETMDVSIEIEGEERPALVARWLTMYVI